jgi:MFS family permease
VARISVSAPAHEFLPHERPLMPGSPATPDHPGSRRLGYFAIGVLLAITGGFLNGLLLANLPQIQGALGLTPVEGGWLTAAYSMTNICMSLLLIKFRQQFGMQRFTRVTLAGFLILNVAQLFVHSYNFEIVLRAASGVVASGLSTLSLFYIMQAMPASKRLGGFVLGIGFAQIATPLARVVSPFLLSEGDIQNLFIFELGLTLACFSSVALLRLPPSERVDAFEPIDFLTFALFAPGMALLCAVLVQGRIQWWSTPWLGWALAGATVLISGALLIERNRANPLLNTRWIGSRDVLRFAAVAAAMRILLSEQSYGALGLFTVVGMTNDQLIGFYGLLTLASLAGLIISVLLLNPLDLLRPVIFATALIAAGAFMDASATNLTRPANLYLSQAMIAFAAIYFVGPTMMAGLLRALAKGPSHIVSFSAVFSISQTLGGIGGAAFLGSFQIIREKFHSNALSQSLVLTDPQIVARIQQLGGAYGRALVDPALRQVQGINLLSQQVAREANILAFNDVFLLIGIMASIVLVWLTLRWAVFKYRGVNPLASELAALQKMMAQRQAT